MNHDEPFKSAELAAKRHSKSNSKAPRYIIPTFQSLKDLTNGYYLIRQRKKTHISKCYAEVKKKKVVMKILP
jgi:hypothetical protein